MAPGERTSEEIRAARGASGAAAGRVRWLEAGLVLVLAALVLVAVAPLFDPSRLHLSIGFIDQANYVASARRLLDTGRLESWLVVPAFVEHPRWRPYLPGYYLALAASFAALGPTATAALLPSWFGFAVAAACTYGIAARQAGTRAARLAAGLFLLFPAGHLYAHTAMAEASFTGVCAAALLGFLALPPRARPWALAPLVGIAFIFRETGALLALPMALVVGGSGDLRRPAVAALAACGAAVVLALALNAWQQADGRELPTLAWVVDGRFNYGDATVQPVARPAGEWLGLFAANVARNLGETREQLLHDTLSLRVASYAAIVAVASAAGFVGLRRRPLDPLLLGTAGTVGCVLVLLYVLYDVRMQKPLRTLLFATPLVAASAGALLAAALERARPGRRAAVTVAGALALGAIAWSADRASGVALAERDRPNDQLLELMDRSTHDPSTLLVAPPELGMSYLVERYPARVSLLPENDATLLELGEREPIGTLLVPAEMIRDRVLTPAGWRPLGLAPLAQDLTLGDQAYRILQRVPEGARGGR